MDNQKISVLLQDLESGSLETLDAQYASLAQEKGNVSCSDLPKLLECLSIYELDLGPVIKTFESKPETKSISLQKIKKNLKRFLTQEQIKSENLEMSLIETENMLKSNLAIESEKQEENSSPPKKQPEDFQLLTEVKDQKPSKIKKKSSSSSDSPNSIKDLSKLKDFKPKKPKKKGNIKKKTTESLSSFADVSKNLTFLTSNKLIRYKFEDLTFTEFQKRLDSQDYLISEKLAANTKPKQVLVDILNLSKIVPKPEEVQLFIKELKSVKEKCNPTVFRKTCEKWYSEVHSPKDLKSKLIVSIKEYETLKSKMMPNEDPTFIDSLITMLKSQLRKIMELVAKDNPLVSLEDRCRSGCHEVFMFYCKNPAAPAPSNLDYKKKFDIIDLPKFLKFSEDFGILEKHKNPEKNRIKKETVEEVYESNSNFKKKMYEYQFFQALENLSLVFFDEIYDLAHKTQWRTLEDEQKVVKFFEVLGFHEPSVYNRKMKGKQYSDLNSLMKYSFDVSNIQNLTPRIGSKAQSTERTLSKVYSSSKLDQKPLKTYKEKPVTWDQLANTGNEDYDLMNLINEESSEEDQFTKNTKLKKKNENTISQKIIKRAEELSKREKKEESEKLHHLLKIAENRNEKQSNITKKFRK